MQATRELSLPLLFVLGLAFLFVSGCSSFSSSDDPSTVIREFDAAFKKGDHKTWEKISTPDTVKTLSMLGAARRQHAAACGPIVSCEHTIEGDTAEAVVNYENGTTEKYNFQKIDGKWKVHFVMR